MMEYTGERVIPNVGEVLAEANFQLHLKEYELVGTLVSPNMVVLDCACGVGYGTDYLGGLVKEIVGIDISEEAINFAKLNYKRDNLLFDIGDVRRLPYSNNSFDALISIETLEHFIEVEKFISEIHRVLKPGGLLFLTTPNGDFIPYERSEGDSGFHVRHYKKEELEKLLKNKFDYNITDKSFGGGCYGIVGKKKDRTTISLVMIVKDEEEILAKCLEHVKDIVDDFVIVDTGSTDGTREIIKKYGPLYEIPFEDFVTTKNKALELAAGDYILWMDADEILYEGRDILRIHADEGNYDALTVRITEGPPDYSIVSMQYDRARMWRRGSFHFVGPGVHEVAVGEGKTIKDVRISVRHEHLKKNKSGTGKERFEKYVGLLKDSISRGNDLYRAWFYLGRTYKDLGSPLDAIDAYVEYLRLPNLTFVDEIWQSHYDIAQCYKTSGEYDKAIHWSKKAVSIDENRSEAYCLLGDLYFQRQEYSEAIEWYQKAIRDIPSNVTLFLSPIYYSIYPKDQLVLCYYFNGDFDKSGSVCKDLISQLNGRDDRILNNLWWVTRKVKSTIFMTLGITPETVYGGMINDVGVGGVETTYLELSEELAKLGKNVFLFCNTFEPHIYRGVYYVPCEQINDYWKLNPDVIITSRWFDPFYVESNSKKIIWFQDAFFGLPDGKPDLFTKADLVVCSSQWHRNYIFERLGRSIKPEKLKIVSLGIRKYLFDQVVTRDPNKVLYSSNPDRGLEHLIDMWDEITKRIPNIHLTVTYGWEGLKTWSGNREWHDSIKRLQVKCFDKANQYKNITFTGRITKVRLAKEMLSSSVLVYPNNFWETFCLTALESQAAGTPMITTNIGALSTVVNTNFNYLIDGSPRSESYQKVFIDQLAKLMEDRIKLCECSNGNKVFVENLDCDWFDIGGKWVNLIYGLLKE